MPGWRYDASMLLDEPVASRAWQARLELDYVRRGACTVLAARRHSGPLRVQKPLYPEGPGVCHSIVLHPPGGIAAGDTLELKCRIGTAAHALLTTPGAAKWYRCDAVESAQRVRLELGADAVCEWLPQEAIVFDGARAVTDLEVHLAPGSRFIGWEVLCLGRTAAGERFRRGRLRTGTRLVAASRTLWLERGTIAGASPLLDSPVGLAGHPVCGLLLAAGGDVGAELLNRLRSREPAAGERGLTRLPGLVVARYLGPSAEQARAYFVGLWQLLRPALIGREAVSPRIWST